MPLIKSNKHNNHTAGSNTLKTENPQFSDFNNGPSGIPPSQAGSHPEGTLVGHLDPATKPFGVQDSRDLNAPGATTQVDGATIPAAGVATKGSASAGEKAFIGKLEHAAGTILCSSSLKAKGIQKEREAQAIKVQAAELGAAERLEQEAKLRRERAVAHGADPQLLHPAGHHPGHHSEQNPGTMNTAVESNGAPNMAGVGSAPVGSLAGANTAQQPPTSISPPQPAMGDMPTTGIAPLHAAHMQPGVQMGVNQQAGMNPNPYSTQAPLRGAAADSAYPPIAPHVGTH